MQPSETFIAPGRKENPVVELPAWRLSQEIHQKNLSCREVMEAYLDRIDAVNPQVNAIVARQERNGLMEQAAAKDALLAGGADEGWMHGFPQAIKDLENTKGIVTTAGYPGMAGFVPEADSLLVSRMKRLGSIVIGKTNTPEWGFGSQTYNEVYGTTGNPYNPALTPGGSSGGAACAVALGMQSVADGSDFMGSLRNPAGFCNVFGYRPSRGRIPSLGFELFYLDCGVNGPMARTVPDLALFVGSVSGPDIRVPASLEDDADLKSLTPQNVVGRLQTEMKSKRVAWLGDLNGYLPMEDGVLELCGEALKKLEDAGLDVEPVKPFFNPAEFWEEIWLPIRHLGSVFLKPFYDDPEKRALLKPESVFEYEGSSKYGIRDLYRAGVLRSEMYAAMLRLFENYDVLAVPTAQVFPFDKRVHWPEEIAGRKMDTYHRWMEVVSHWTLMGVPVAAVPAGFDAKDRPMGIQLIGKPRGDWELLRFAYGYEQIHAEICGRRPELG